MSDIHAHVYVLDFVAIMVQIALTGVLPCKRPSSWDSPKVKELCERSSSAGTDTHGYIVTDTPHTGIGTGTDIMYTQAISIRQKKRIISMTCYKKHELLQQPCAGELSCTPLLCSALVSCTPLLCSALVYTQPTMLHCISSANTWSTYTAGAKNPVAQPQHPGLCSTKCNMTRPVVG